jgi:hypothetical protein
LELKRQEIETNAEIAVAKMTQELEKNRESLHLKQQLDGARLGVDIARSRAEMKNRSTKKE